MSKNLRDQYFELMDQIAREEREEQLDEIDAYEFAAEYGDFDYPNDCFDPYYDSEADWIEWYDHVNRISDLKTDCDMQFET